MIARNQRWLENWGKEGSEAKTTAQRAFRVLVKMLEAWDEVSSHWAKIHSTLEATVQGRLAFGDAVRRSGQSLPPSITDLDQQLLAAARELNYFDSTMFSRLTEWQKRMDEWQQWRDRVYPTVANVIAQTVAFGALLHDAHTIAEELRAQLSQLEWRYPMLHVPPFRMPTLSNPQQDTMGPAD